MKIQHFLLIALLSVSASSYAQNVGINTDASVADKSAMLDVKSTNKGMLIPRMTKDQKGKIENPATGLLIYQTDDSTGFYFNKGTASLPLWQYISTGAAGPQGIAGAKGDKGDKGDTGLQGIQGPDGPQGIQGLQGVQGDIGATGEKGDKGDTGQQGIQGIQGITGEAGPAGAVGPKGDKGDAGIQGIQGNAGEQGPTGAIGPKGDAGTQGSQGIQGVKGDTGAQGPQGIQGPKGDAGAGAANGTAPYQVYLTGATSPYAPAPQNLTGDVSIDQVTGSFTIGQTVIGSSRVTNLMLQPNSVTTSKVANGTVTTSKMADSAISGLKLLTAAVQTKHILNGAVTINKLNATGTADATTFLRGDGAWAEPVAVVPTIYTATRNISSTIPFASVTSSNVGNSTTEVSPVLSLLTSAYTAKKLVIYNGTTANVTFTLRFGPTPTSLANTALTVTAAPNATASVTSDVLIPANSFISFGSVSSAVNFGIVSSVLTMQ